MLEIDNTDIVFTFPANNASAKIIIHGFAELLIHHHGVPHNIASDSLYKNKKVHARRIHRSYHVTQHPETASLIKWPFEDSITALAR